MGVDIVAGPQGQTVNAGDTATLSVTALGTGPLGYQWTLNGVAVAGATNSSLVITNARNGAAGIYAVTVSNAGSSQTSAGAILTVVYPPGTPVDPAIVAAPVSTWAVAGGNTALSVGVSGTGPFGYQWELNGTNVVGATGAVLNLTNVLASQGGNYSVVISNAAGSVTSGVVTLAVDVPLTVWTVSATGGGYLDGPVYEALFQNPLGVAVDGMGNVYVADTQNQVIRQITPLGMVSTLAGQPGVSGSADGIGSTARFYNPEVLALDSAGNLYVADVSNGSIRKVTASGVVTTLAGGLASPSGSQWTSRAMCMRVIRAITGW